MHALVDYIARSEKTAVRNGSRPAHFFQTAQETFHRAAAATSGYVEHYYLLAGHLVCLRFAGPALVPYITPALNHREVAPTSAPALTISLWDSVATRTPMPAPPWDPTDHGARGEIRGFNDGRYHTVFQHGANALSMLDSAQNQAIYWVRDAKEVPYYEIGAPLRNILHWWLSRRGWQLFHGAAVGTPTGGVLMGGKGGSGKSTTALSCLASRLFYVGDDYVLLGQRSGPYVHSLYNSAKLNADSVERLPFLASKVQNADRLDTEKALMLVHESFPEKLIAGFPIRALLVPRVTGRHDTRFKPASPAASLTALAPSTIFQLPGAGRETFQTMASMVQQVPSYFLELGTDVNQIPLVIGKLLMGL